MGSLYNLYDSYLMEALQYVSKNNRASHKKACVSLPSSFDSNGFVVMAYLYSKRPLFHWILLTVFSGLSLSGMTVIAEEGERVDIVDPYLEIHSGPGRNYPVINVVEKGDSLNVLSRKANWYRVSWGEGKQGWSQAEQLDRTLYSGVPMENQQTGHKDYLNMNWSVGFNYGQFEGAETLAVRGGYKPFRWVGVEVEYGQTFGSTRDVDYYSGQLFVEPFPHWQFSPFMTLGQGEKDFKLKSKSSGVEGENADFERGGIGVNYYIGYNFVVRGEYQWYSLSVEGIELLEERVERQSSAWVIGFSSFF